MSLITKSVDILAQSVAAGFSTIASWPIMSGKLGYGARNTFINVTALTYTMFKHYIGNLGDIKPSAVVAGIPLPSVDELSHGISDREVRYRANGGVFLAHQSGGNESLRIVGKAWGVNRFLFLNMLGLLFLWGSSTTIDVLKSAAPSLLSIGPAAPVAGSGWPFPSAAADRLKSITRDPWVQFKKENLKENYKEQHLTFPVVTRDRVYISMYIETYSWRQRLDKEGRKMVEYTIFFRKYEPELEREYGIIVIPPKRPSGAQKTIAVYRQKTINRPMIYAAWKATIEITATIAINPQFFNAGTVTTFGYQFVMNYFGSGELDDRIPGIIEQRGFF